MVWFSPLPCHYFHAINFELLTPVMIAARVVTDRVTGFSKGFGFVRYSSVQDASQGIEGMDGKV
jgi:RNA recognition motif-containing protein